MWNLKSANNKHKANKVRWRCNAIRTTSFKYKTVKRTGWKNRVAVILLRCKIGLLKNSPNVYRLLCVCAFYILPVCLTSFQAGMANNFPFAFTCRIQFLLLLSFVWMRTPFWNRICSVHSYETENKISRLLTFMQQKRQSTKKPRLSALFERIAFDSVVQRCKSSRIFRYSARERF